MSSRIEEEPDEFGDRAHEMYKGNWHIETIRMCRNESEISPIIAKGNRFDGIDAWV